MRNTREITDQLSISLSLLCAIHCLLVPFVLILLPTLAVLQLDYEAFHYWMLVTVIPMNVYALTVGCKQHKRYRLLVLGFTGLSLLILAVFIGEDITGEWGERILTVFGASLVAGGHYWNFRLCQKDTNCACPEH